LIDYFASFPILKFKLVDVDGSDFTLDWFPSEYLFQQTSGQYCVALEGEQSSQVTLGGVLLRQHNMVFDIDQNKIGIAHAQCSKDPNQILSESILIDKGHTTGFIPSNHTLDSVESQ
jgi:hypothetical protein